MNASHPLGPVFRLLARWVDDTLPQGVLAEFLARRLAEYQQWFAAQAKQEKLVSPVFPSLENGGAWREQIQGEWSSLISFASREPTTDSIPFPAAKHNEGWQETMNAWSASLPTGLVLSSQGLAPGDLLRLLSLHDLEDPLLASFLSSNLESLLRHVEVKRSTCLPLLLRPPGEPAYPPESAWIERSTLSLLFTRHARQSADYRFLNAALKLNDWGYSFHRRLVLVAPPLVRYLRAVAEAERLFADLE